MGVKIEETGVNIVLILLSDIAIINIGRRVLHRILVNPDRIMGG